MKKNQKALAGVLSAVMLAASIPAVSIAADEMSISGIFKPGYTISGSYSDEAEYSWYRSNSADGQGELIDGASDSEYTLKNADGGKYITCVAMVDGAEVARDSVFVDKSLAKYANAERVGIGDSDNENYIFNLENESDRGYVLLDTSDDDSSKFFILTSGGYGTHSFDTSGRREFNPDNSANIAYWLNNDFITNGNGGKNLPASIVNHIDKEHVWLTDGVGGGDDYIAKCGISLLSANEAKQYGSKFGFKGGRGDLGWYWWTRSTAAESGAPLTIRTEADWFHQTGEGDGGPAVRPVFWLDREFFKEAEIDYDTLGSEVKSVIRAEYEKSELEGVFSEAELVDMGYDPEQDASLTVSNVRISGETKPGYTLMGEYDWTAASPEGESLYRWYIGESPEDKGVLAGSSNEYALKNADAGKYIRFEVIPQNQDLVFGSACRSESLLVDQPLQKYENGAFGGVASTNPIYKFQVKGDSSEYILLDVSDNEKSCFFVMTAGYFGKRAFDNSGAAFDPSRTENIAYWLNNGFRTEGADGVKLADGILQYIDDDHIWLTDGVDGGDDYITKCGVSLISVNEAKQYIQKFGYAEATYYWWTRSSWGANPLTIRESNAFQVTGAADASPAVRPVFWLGRDFFKNVKVNFETLGTDVKQVIKATYKKDELANTFSEEELVALGYDPEQDDSLVVSNVGISGEAKPGYTLSGNYDWTDESTEGESIYRWYISEGLDDEGVLAGSTKEYTIRNADAGKYIRFSVIPKSADSVFGALCESERMLIAAALEQYENFSAVGGMPAADARYKFRIESAPELDYILLDESGSSESKFFVMTTDYFGQRRIDTSGKNDFDPNRTENIAFWLNHEFKSEGDGIKKLPDEVLSNIDHEHEWLTSGVGSGDDYLVKCGIALLSANEAKQYAGKYGYSEATYYWWLRSTIQGMPCTVREDGVFQVTGGDDGAPAVRPVFWLDRDFFKSVRLDLSSAGEEVIKMITDNYARDELSAIYTSEELEKFGYDSCAVYDIVLSDAAGNELAKPDSSVDGLSVSARFASYNEDINAVMIVALYDKDGGMYGIGMDSRFVSKDSSQTFSVDMSEFSIKNGTTMKVMFWDDFMNMTPLVDEKNF